MSSQNTSSAVMAQRKEPHDSLDFFPTPPWATRALCEKVLLANGFIFNNKVVLDPACGEGHMARPLTEYFRETVASDVHDYGYGKVDDFLFPNANHDDVDWVITNPPFRLGQQFIEGANRTAKVGTAMLVRTAFLEGQTRYNELFSYNPPSIVAQFAERVPMVKGRVDEEASTATSYCWLVWFKGGDVGTSLVWIPPCRKELEREGDYGEPRHIADIAGPVFERAIGKVLA